VRQTVNGATTNYTLDLNTDLTQVLADGANTYLYGMGRIAQQNAGGTDYFLTDALGSARQLAGIVGAVSRIQSYAPFGKLLTADGARPTPYGFAGEWTDATGLTYLRARYYGPQWGRFLTRDPFPGLATWPQSQNPYAYGLNNPIRYTDPSGACVFTGADTLACIGIAIVLGMTISAAFNYGSQVYNNYQNGITDARAWYCVDGKQLLIAALAGGIAGGIGAFTFGATMWGGAFLFGSSFSGLGGIVAAGALSGVISGQTARVVNNVAGGKQQRLFDVRDMLIDAALGGAISGIFYGVSTLGKIVKAEMMPYAAAGGDTGGSYGIGGGGGGGEFPQVVRRYLSASDYQYFLQSGGRLRVYNGRSYWTDTWVSGSSDELIQALRIRASNTVALIDVAWKRVPALANAPLVDSPFGATSAVRFVGMDLEYIWSWRSAPIMPTEIEIPRRAVIAHGWNPF